MDIPSKIKKDELSVLVDNVTASAFTSSNGILGETQEVWFIHGGYLYEVTSAKSLEQMIIAVISSWKFF